jgi:hypothetical protein
MAFNATLPELADLEAPHSINSLEADLLRDAVAQLWEGPNGADQNERLRPAVENLVYILNHHWLMWAHGWELTIGNDFSPGDIPIPQEVAEPVPVNLCQWDDVYDIASDAIDSIDARLQRRGIQLENASSNALQLALEKVLGEAEVEILDNEGTPLDPNEQHRGEVA